MPEGVMEDSEDGRGQQRSLGLELVQLRGVVSGEREKPGGQGSVTCMPDP